MSESQTGAKTFEIFEIFKNFEILNFVNIKNDPRDMLNNFCFHLYAQNSPSNFLTLSRYLTLTLSISHSITLDMLNNFCFHL